MKTEVVKQHFDIFRMPISVRVGGNLVPVDGPAVPDDRLEADERQGQLRRLDRGEIRSGEVTSFSQNTQLLRKEKHHCS